MQDYPFPLASNAVGYQHSFLLTAVTPYPQVDAVQEEVNYILQRQIMMTPVVEGFLKDLICPRNTGAGEAALSPKRLERPFKVPR